MKNYRFYNFDGDSINVFGISDTVFANDPVDVFGVSSNDHDADYVGKIIGLLQSEQITGIEYDFVISAIAHVEIDEQGHVMIDRPKPFDEWWDENVDPVFSSVMWEDNVDPDQESTITNTLLAIRDTACRTFEAGRKYERKILGYGGA